MSGFGCRLVNLRENINDIGTLKKDDEYYLHIVHLPSCVCVIKQIVMLIMMGAQSGNNNVPILQRFLSRGQGCRRINTQDMTFHLLAAPHGVCLGEPPFSSDNSPLINDVLWRWHEASLEELVNTFHMFIFTYQRQDF